MTDTWATLQEIREALARFERDLGWQRPALHGLGFPVTEPVNADEDEDPPPVEVPGGIEFIRVNGSENLLPAAALATVTGWRGGVGTVRVSQDRLAEAIALLAPAEACKETAHPDLTVWREVHGWHWCGSELIAVFDPDPGAPTTDPYVVALRDMVASGRQDVPPGEIRDWPPPGTDGHPLRARWDGRWPNVPPISFELRSLDDHWVRFHSLPGSKRYADTEAEYATVLHRHNTVLTELAGQDDDLLLLTVEVAFAPVPARRLPILEELLPEAECWSIFSWPYLDPQLAFGHAYVSPVGWRPGRLDHLLRRVADDEVANVIVAPPDLSWLYAPYDGGADVLLATPELRDDVRNRHRDRLSDHPAGL